MSENHKPQISKCPPVKINTHTGNHPLTAHNPQVLHCAEPLPIVICCDPVPEWIK